MNDKENKDLTHQSIRGLIKHFNFDKQKDGFIKNFPLLDLADFNSNWFVRSVFDIYEKIKENENKK